jgi:hypothetical protein
VLARTLSVLAESGIRPRALHAGPLRISATIDEASLPAAQRALHATFVG